MQNSQALFPFDLGELKTFISDCVAQGIAAATIDTKATAEPEGYLSRIEAAKLLHISLQTLNEKTKAGELTGYRIGARVLYKRAELEAALISTARYRQTGKKTGPKPKPAAAA